MPIRTCIGCGKQDEKINLLRVSCAVDMKISDSLYWRVSSEGKGSGRGVYLHRENGCVENALNIKVLARRFRKSISTTQLGQLEEVLVEEMLAKEAIS